MLCSLTGVYTWYNITVVHRVYVVLEVYTPGAILQCSPCVCSLRGLYIHLVQYYSGTTCVCSLTGVYTWCSITVVHHVYVVLEVYTPGAVLQCSSCVCSLRGLYIHLVQYYSGTPCVCSLTGGYTRYNITVVHPVYVDLQVYTPGAILQWYIMYM